MDLVKIPLDDVYPFSVSDCRSSLKHTRFLFKAGLFLQVEHNIYSSVCGASFFLAHLLLLSENITPPPPLVLCSFRGFKALNRTFLYYLWLLQYFKCPCFVSPWHLTHQQPRGMGKSCICCANRFTFVLACFSRRLPGYLPQRESRMLTGILTFCLWHHCPVQCVLQFECQEMETVFKPLFISCSFHWVFGSF